MLQFVALDRALPSNGSFQGQKCRGRGIKIGICLADLTLPAANENNCKAYIELDLDCNGVGLGAELSLRKLLCLRACR